MYSSGHALTAMAAGHAMEMVETIVDIRAQDRFGPRQIVIKLGFGRHRGCAAVA